MDRERYQALQGERAVAVPHERFAPFLLALTAALLIPSAAASQPSLEILKAFASPPRTPASRLVQATNGVLYGTTRTGGSSGAGTVFSVNPDGTEFATLHNFTGPNGRDPQAGLIQGTDGTLYGTTFRGGSSGSGTVFKIRPDGTGFATLFNFDGSNGRQVAAALIQGTDGVLYGTTRGGRGTVFKINPDGTDFATVLDFDDVEEPGGRRPAGALIQGTDGALYGTTIAGGASGQGTVFKISPDGTGFETLFEFDDTTGFNPQAGLIQGTDGALYGTTVGGGTSEQGTVFKVNTDGSDFAALLNFAEPSGSSNSLAGLIQATDGALYGTTSQGGAGQGTVFKLNPDGTGFATLLNFNGANGSLPLAALIQATDGSLYGTTSEGGSGNAGGPGNGTVFKIELDGNGFAPVLNFSSAEGSYPYAGLIQAEDGDLYGATSEGGLGYGTVFKLNPDGLGFETIFAFDGTNGRNPFAGLTQGTDGALYGTTSEGGAAGFGTVFKVDANGGGFMSLHSFDDTDGSHPKAGLLQATNGALYGTTSEGGSGHGTVFKLNPDGTGFTTLLSFDGANGSHPYAGLIQATDGALYGTTYQGGLAYGTLFKLNLDGTGFATVLDFDNTNAGHTYGRLLQGADGAFYGTTYFGGIFGLGAVFKVNPDGTDFATLFSFNGDNGRGPQAELIQGPDGPLYGTTSDNGPGGYGTVFKINPNGSDFETLIPFDDNNEHHGGQPYAGLIRGTDGALYGTTPLGGPNGGGTVYRVVLSPAASLSGDLSFGDQLVGSTSSPLTLTVTNPGGPPLHVASVGITGSAAADYDVVSDSCTGASVASGSTCEVSVVFHPTQAGPRLAAVGIADDAPDSPQTVGLDGTGIADTLSPAVGLTAPNGGERVFTGTPYIIRWTASDDIGVTSIDVESSSNGGTSFSTVSGCTGLAGTAVSCDWSVPAPATTQGRIRVTAHDASGNSGAATSAANFSVITGTASVTLTAPGAGITWRIGNTQNITFSHSLGVGQKVGIDLSRDGGASWTTINSAFVTTSATTGTLAWGVTGPTTAAARVRVTWSGNPAVTSTGVNFAIVDRITITAPNTAVAWAVGTSHSITWNHNLGTSESVDIDLSRDGGVTWFPIATNVANSSGATGTFSWVVSAPASTAARVRVRWTADPSVNSVSAVNFTISGTIAVTSPTGSSSWGIGSSRTVSFTHNLGAGQTFDILLSTDGGVTFPTTIASSVVAGSASGSYTWIVPGPASTTARVRVAWSANSTVAGTTGNFTMAAPAVTLTAPTTAVTWTVGNTQAITWSHNLGTQESVNIDESIDGGATWSQVANVPNTSNTTGTFSWVVSSPPTTAARVRVTWPGNAAVTSASAVNFTIVDRIRITAPNTAVTWAVGSTHAINWNHNLGTSQAVDIDVSRDGGVTWTSIATNVPNSAGATGTFSWVVSAPASTTARVRVSWTADPSVKSVSSVNFTISGTISMTAPTGGPSWGIGSTRTVSWNHTLGAGQLVNITLSTDGGATFPTTIATGVSAGGPSGTYSWVVSGPASTTARIRVTWAASSVVAGTTGNFTMTAPAITLTAPNAAVNWAIGTTRAITWNHNLGTQELVDIDQSSDGGTTWSQVAAGVANTANTTGTFNWLVASSPTTTARIRVRWAANTAVAGQSAANFTIASPFVTVTSPNTAVTWAIGSSHNIAFSHNLGAGQTVNIDVSPDGGSTYDPITTVATTSATAGSFAWTVTGPATTQARVRATWTGNPTVMDASNANFTVQ